MRRANIIPKQHKEELQKYTTGIIQNRKHKLLAINYMPDHVHIVIVYHIAQPISDLLRDIKANTSSFPSSIQKNGCRDDSNGKRVMVPFLTLIHN